MSLFDSNAFVVSGTAATVAGTNASVLTAAYADSTTAKGDILLLVAPCDLEVQGVQLFASTPGTTTGTGVNIKVVPPTTSSVYARTYNYTAVSKVVSTLATTDGTTWTGTTTAPHGLTSSSVIKLDNFFNTAFNLREKPVASVASTTTFTITTSQNYQLPLIGTASSSNLSVSGNVYTIITTNAHGLKVGDYVTTGAITGATTAYTITNAAKVTSVLSSTKFTVDVSIVLTGSANIVGVGSIGGATVKVFPTYTSPTGSGLAQTVTAGFVASPVQDQNYASDLSVAADFTPVQANAFYAYGYEQLIPAGASTAQFGAAVSANNGDPRVNNMIKAGSLVYLSVTTISSATALAGLVYSVEFTKN